jgi:hypothetical protein
MFDAACFGRRLAVFAKCDNDPDSIENPQTPRFDANSRVSCVAACSAEDGGVF